MAPIPLGTWNSASWASSAASLTSTTFDAAAGDLLLVLAGNSAGSPAQFGAPANSGAPLSWTLVKASTAANTGGVTVWAAVVDTARTGMTVTVAQAGGLSFGWQLSRWGNAAVGASVAAASSGGAAPSATLTTTGNNSAVVLLIVDYWETSGTRTWRTGAGAATETVYAVASGYHTVYGAYHLAAGAAGAKTVGLTAPAPQGFGMVAVEIVSSGLVVSPPGIGAGAAVGTPTIIRTEAAPAGIPPASAAGTPAVTFGPVTVTPGGVDVDAEVGTPQIPARVDSWRQVIEGAPWRRAVTARERYVGVRVEMIDQASGRHVVNVPVVSGSVSFNGEDAEQWACSFSVVGEEWVPTRADSVLGPVSGLLCRVWWRVRTDESDWMEVPVGTYVLEDPRVHDDGTTVTVDVTGRDPLALIRRTGYGSATVAVGGLDVPTALARIMTAVAPQQPVRIDTTSTELLPAVYELGSGDVGKDLTAIANAAGWVVRTDRDGTIVFGPSPDPDTPRADWSEGPDCVVTDITRDIATSSMVNSVTVTSNNTEVDPPVVATAEDDDPSSPTYVGGPWNRRNIPVQSDVVSTYEAAYNYAKRILSGRRRPTESVSVTVMPRGDLGYRDVVSLRRDQAGVAGLYRVGKWSLSIGSGEDAPALMKVEMLPKVTL